MDKITLTIDGQDITVKKGATVLEAALQNGIHIPHLCHHPDLKPAGACRLCIVELGDGQLVTSCLMPAEEGMMVETESPKVVKLRHAIVELLIADHHFDCRRCPSSRHCELQRIMASLGISVKRMRPLRWAKEILSQDVSNACFDYDPDKCLLCGVCLRACEKAQGESLLYFIGRGYSTRIAFFGDGSICETCMGCISVCPVGALRPKNPQRPVSVGT